MEKSSEGMRTFFQQPVVASFIAGGVAGAVSRTVVSPLERLKILFQVQGVGRNEYKMSVPKALAKMWRDEGWRGFMAGNGTNCIRIVPYSAVQFSAYNVYKRVSQGSFGADLLGVAGNSDWSIGGCMGWVEAICSGGTHDRRKPAGSGWLRGDGCSHVAERALRMTGTKG